MSLVVPITTVGDTKHKVHVHTADIGSTSKGKLFGLEFIWVSDDADSEQC